MRWRINYLFKRLLLHFFPPKPLLSKEEHLILLDKARRLDHIQEDACKLLKCSPGDLNSKVEKLMASITDLEAQIASYNQPKPEHPSQK